ncbi:sensor histidine kinase [Paenibacillus rhizoplanae]
MENSILHGFRSEGHTGRIIIRVYREGTFIVCKVEDNGEGFDKERVEAGLVEAGRQEHGGYALLNVYTRLRLHYGDKAAMELESEPYKLTAVTLRFPGEYEDN